MDSSGMATVEIVGFQGQTAPTTIFSKPTTKPSVQLVVEQFCYPLKKNDLCRIEYQGANQKWIRKIPKKILVRVEQSIIMRNPGLNRTAPLSVEPINFDVQIAPNINYQTSNCTINYGKLTVPLVVDQLMHHRHPWDSWCQS